MIQAGHDPAATTAGTRAWGAQALSAVPFRHGAIRLRGAEGGPGTVPQAPGWAPGASGRIRISGATYGRVAAPPAPAQPAAGGFASAPARVPVGHGTIRLRGVAAPAAAAANGSAAALGANGSAATPAGSNGGGPVRLAGRDPVGHGPIRLRAPRG